MCATYLTKTERQNIRYLTGLCKDRYDKISFEVNVYGSYLEVTLFEHMIRYRISLWFSSNSIVKADKILSNYSINTSIRNNIPISFDAT